MPKLMHRLKWFQSDKDLVIGDLVYFVKKEGALENKWIMGMVESVEKGRDGIIREAVIKYCNSSEQKLSLGKGDSQPNSTYPKYTEVCEEADQDLQHRGDQFGRGYGRVG